MNRIPKVVIVGRMNVGKSTLFNRLSTSVKSLTLDYAGVTRDFISDIVSWQGVSFELIDSGGIDIKNEKDSVAPQVKHIVHNLLNQADILLFVCDGKSGLLPEDFEIAKLLRKTGKEFITVVNKVDTQSFALHQHEFQRLGAQTFEISANHGIGIGELLSYLADQVKKIKPQEHVPEKTKFNMVLLGKPNVGKSSLMNLLLEQERSIVYDEPGTTREPITEQLRFYQETIQVTDTPGIRRKRGVTETLETMMVKTSFKAVERADIVLLLIDASEGQLSDQELKLAFYAFEHDKALIILQNKSDKTTELTKSDLEYEYEKYEYFLKKIPTLEISCKTGKNIGKILPLVTKVWNRYTQIFDSQELTQLFKHSLEKTPLYHKTSPLILKRVKQIKSAPLLLVLFVNEPAWFGPSQLSFFENIMRKHYDLEGVPVRFIPQKNKK